MTASPLPLSVVSYILSDFESVVVLLAHQLHGLNLQQLASTDQKVRLEALSLTSVIDCIHSVGSLQAESPNVTHQVLMREVSR